MTTSCTGPGALKAVSLTKALRIRLLTAGADQDRPWLTKRQSPSPMRRLTSEQTSSGRERDWARAGSPVMQSSAPRNSTTLGRVSEPSSSGTTSGAPEAFTVARQL